MAAPELFRGSATGSAGLCYAVTLTASVAPHLTLFLASLLPLLPHEAISPRAGMAVVAVTAVGILLLAGWLSDRAARLAPDRTLLGERVPLLPDGPDVPPEKVSVSAKRRLKHVYAIGSTGSGKTNLLMNVISADVEAGRSVAVFDLRGDLVDRLLLRLAASGAEDIGERLVLVDLRDTEHAVPYNPLLGPGDTYTRALYVLSVLREQADSWGVQLEETLRNCLMALAETGWSLLETEPLLMHAGFRAQVLAGVTDPYVHAFFHRYGSLVPDKQRMWALPVLNKVTPFLSLPALRRMFGARGSLDFSDLFDRREGTVFLAALAVDRLHEAAHLAGGLLVSGLQNAMMARADVPEAERRPVYLYLDEFETMATDRFEAIIAEGRRFGLSLTLSHQNLSQLPVGLRQVVLNNVQTQLYFRTGAGDAAELARETVSDASKEEIRLAMMTQDVGEAFLVRRGQETVRLAVPRYADPSPAPEAVTSLKDASWSRHARESGEVDAELRARIDELDRTPSGKGAKASGPAYEVRYAKTNRLRS